MHTYGTVGTGEHEEGLYDTVRTTFCRPCCPSQVLNVLYLEGSIPPAPEVCTKVTGSTGLLASLIRRAWYCQCKKAVMDIILMSVTSRTQLMLTMYCIQGQVCNVFITGLHACLVVSMNNSDHITGPLPNQREFG